MACNVTSLLVSFILLYGIIASAQVTLMINKLIIDVPHMTHDINMLNIIFFLHTKTEDHYRAYSNVLC